MLQQWLIYENTCKKIVQSTKRTMQSNGIVGPRYAFFLSFIFACFLFPYLTCNKLYCYLPTRSHIHYLLTALLCREVLPLFTAIPSCVTKKGTL
ncbi:hypothetical protein BDV35DRAFT_373480, partial [Aspergillus flavus]